MTTCIKCGKEIPDGELFCAECGLNPGAAPSRPRPSVPAQPGRMQTPVRRTESPKSSEKQPQEPTGKQPAKPEKKEKRPGRALTVCAACCSVRGMAWITRSETSCPSRASITRWP